MDAIDALLNLLQADHKVPPKVDVPVLSRNMEFLNVGGQNKTQCNGKEMRLRQMIDDAVSAVLALRATLLDGDVTEDNYLDIALKIMSNDKVSSLLMAVSESSAFSASFQRAFQEDIERLRALKKLKFWYNSSGSEVMVELGHLLDSAASNGNGNGNGNGLRSLFRAVSEQMVRAWRSEGGGQRVGGLRKRSSKMAALLAANGVRVFEDHRERMAVDFPHSVFPTNHYRVSGGHVIGSTDSQQIEAVMHLSITTSIRIERGILSPDSAVLKDIYVPFGRCVAMIDDKVAAIYGAAIASYFEAQGVALEVIAFSGLEADKHIGSVQDILDRLKAVGIERNEPLLVVGGGVTADIGGFATALYHRSTPYVMLSTSIVSGIDAGPSPRTCCDGFGYKNIFGAYAPPIVTLTDCSFFRTLPRGVIRHGIAEIIKMAVVKDRALFMLLEKCGKKLIATKFGTDWPEDVQMEPSKRSQFIADCDEIVGKAMASYVRSEYGNLWETHQCRPHAYGHSWSPGFELPAGLLHGHAVSCGMGYGAFLAFKLKGWLAEAAMLRVLRLINGLELSLWHPVMDNVDFLWGAQLKMIAKRGGNLCAPVPSGSIGECGYINDLSRDDMEQTLREYKALCQSFERNGLGVEPLCKDVGLEDPSTHCGHSHKHKFHGHGSSATESVRSDETSESDEKE